MLKVGEIIQTVKGIVETKIDLIKSDIQDQFVGMMAKFLLYLLIGIMSFIVLIFLSLALAFYISQFTKLPYMGFLLVALFYLLVVIALFLARKSDLFNNKIPGSLRDSIFSGTNKNKNEDEQTIGT